MNKNFLNKNQKRILYRNIGILLTLTALCAVLVRCGGFGGGETLEDLARKQEQASEEAPNAITPAENLPAKKEDASETASGLPSAPSEKESEGQADISEQSEDETDQPVNKSDQPQGDDFMKDRVTYQEGFYYQSLSDAVKERITGISYPADDGSAAISYDTLRYVRILYYDFNGETQSGELICHKAIAQDLLEIFHELYEIHYPIEKICLVDEYQGNDDLSMQDNNTSCFNYRALPSGRLSNHAYGLAIDLNPFYNPYITTGKDGSVHIAPEGSDAYADRERSFAYKIDKEDPAYQLFIQHGFTWGGNWRSSKDYQHFEKEI